MLEPYFSVLSTSLKDAGVYIHNNGVVWLYPEGGHTRYFQSEIEFRKYELTQGANE
jgi:hypothetical protein